jgi:tRNA-2-methylthio-N6-dimethylallyladenosine synthase
MSGKLYLRTYGCQMNEYDSAAIAGVLAAAEGLEPTAQADEADVIVFNTCSVREKAQEKVFADLGRVRHLIRPTRGLLWGVGGCFARMLGAGFVGRAG